MLTFDELQHEYRWNGRVVPGVTDILKPISGYDGIPASVLARAAERGSAVHLATELDDCDELDEDSLDPVLAPYLAAWRTFRAEHACEWEHIEKRMYHRTLGYAGTADRIGTVDGLRSVLDVKTTLKLMPTVGPQLAAYEMQASQDTPGARLARYGVQLRADGTYHLERYDDPNDAAVFVSLLTLRGFCQRHNINL